MTAEAVAEPRTLIMSGEDVRRALARMGHELVERNAGTGGLVLVGIRTRGVPLARRMANLVAQFEGVNLPYGGLDITLYRDDLDRARPRPPTPASHPGGLAVRFRTE